MLTCSICGKFIAYHGAVHACDAMTPSPAPAPTEGDVKRAREYLDGHFAGLNADDPTYDTFDLEHLAALIAQAREVEREACAKAADEVAEKAYDEAIKWNQRRADPHRNEARYINQRTGAHNAAAAIRVRSNPSGDSE